MNTLRTLACDLSAPGPNHAEQCVEPVILRPREENDPPAAVDANNLGTGQMIELILKDRPRLHEILRTTTRKTDLAVRLLTISLVSFVLYGVAMSLTFDAAATWPSPTPATQWLSERNASLATFHTTDSPLRFVESWYNGRAFRLIAAFSFGLIAASGVCLPSLYFYGLLSGLRMSMTDVVLHALKGKAVSAVALVGILPVYAALAMGAVVFPIPEHLVQGTLLLGLCLPFIAGLWGTRSLFVGFSMMCGMMPEAFQQNRACFLRRLVLSWCACYTAIAPVMIHTVWQHLGG
jgi:hypothetical protein